MTFSIGDSVKIKEGIMCPDDDSVGMSGWQGRIFEIEEDEDTVGIRWDSITLKELPRKYITQSEKEGLDWTEIYLSTGEIKPVLPRDSETTANHVRQEMENEFFWLGGGKEGQRILKVIANAEDEVEAWNNYLAQVLSFPFDAEVSEPQDKGPLDEDDRVMVHGIAEADDFYGILVNLTSGQKRFVFPLCDLTVGARKSSNYTPVKDYCVWFANR